MRSAQRGIAALDRQCPEPRFAKYRVPDVLARTNGVIGEVKNVGRLSYGSQLRDYAAYAQQQGLRFYLTVRRTMRLSGPLQQAVGRGEVNLRYVP